MIRTSESTKLVTAALAEFQAEALHVPKNANNPFYDSRYADLFSIKQICDPTLRAKGLLLTQFPGGGESGNSTLITRLVHVESGEFMEAEAHLPLAKDDPQSLGSAVTYVRRYSYCAILGIVADPDDDGNAGTQASRKQQARKPEPEYEMVNGEQIPLSPRMDTVRTGPGGVDATPLNDAQQKKAYAIVKGNWGQDANVSEVLSEIFGRPIKHTNMLGVHELDKLAELAKSR